MPGITCSAYGTASCGDGRRGIRVPDLGYLTIGEVYVKNGTRSLEMLRLDRFAPRTGRVRTLEEPPPPVVAGGVEGTGRRSIPDEYGNPPGTWRPRQDSNLRPTA